MGRSFSCGVTAACSHLTLIHVITSQHLSTERVSQSTGVCVQALLGCARAADLVIEIPGWGAEGAADGAHYRLDYRPPQGSPAPNFTVPARASTINFQGLPGTKYHFMLYYSNATFADLLTWNQTIITGMQPLNAQVLPMYHTLFSCVNELHKN